jgi:hypothetical protein
MGVIKIDMTKGMNADWIRASREQLNVPELTNSKKKEALELDKLQYSMDEVKKEDTPED